MKDTDIVERLRAFRNIYNMIPCQLAQEAADEIERLRAALKVALDVMTINEKVRSPSWNGEATKESAIGQARAAMRLKPAHD